MRLVLLGPPGSGKGTQAAASCRAARRPQDLDRRHAARRAQGRARRSGAKPTSYMTAGKLVPDEVVIGLVDERAQAARRRRRASFSTDFRARCPRPRRSSALLEAARKPLDAWSRSTFRASFSWSGPPCAAPTNGLDRSTTSSIVRPPPDAELEHRADDQEETVKKRLDAYEAHDRGTSHLTTKSSAFCAGSTGWESPKRSPPACSRALGLIGRRTGGSERRNLESESIEEVLPSALFRVRLSDGRRSARAGWHPSLATRQWSG